MHFHSFLLVECYYDLCYFGDEFLGFLKVRLLTLVVDAAYLVGVLLQVLALTEEDRLVPAGGVQEYDLTPFYMVLVLLHMLVNTLLQHFLIFSPHL